MLDQNLESLPSKPLRRLALGTKQSAKSGASGKGEHFVEPWRLTDKEKKVLNQALATAEIGDPEGRRIFAGALEYELSEFRGNEAAQPLVEEPEPAPAEPQADVSALREIEQLALELAAKLGQLPEDQEPNLLATLETRDEMGRGYSTRYLDSLYQEANRLAEACGLVAANLATPPPPPKAKPAPGPSPAMVKLVGSLTHVFEECFEQTPTAAAKGPFALTLKAVGEVIGLKIPHSKAVLEQVLKGR